MAGSSPAVESPLLGEEDEWVEPLPAASGGMQMPADTAPAGVAAPGATASTTPLRVLGRNLLGQQSGGSPPSSADQESTDLTKAVVMLAEIQKQLLEKTQQQEASNSTGNKKPVMKNITSVRLPEFKGGKAVTTKDYRLWRKMAMAHMQLHRLEPSEMALLLYLSVGGEATELGKSSRSVI